MDRSEAIRTWGPVLLVLALLPAAFVGLRMVLPPIGPQAPAPVAPVPAPPPVGGSARCATCHADQAASWSTSNHALAERELLPSDPIVDGALPLPGREPIRPVRVIGREPLFQFLVPTTGGRLQVTQDAWDVNAGAWFDVFGDGRTVGEWGHWTGGAMTWNSQCATCHDTGVRKGFDAAADAYDTHVDEVGVGCVACHTGAEDHVTGGTMPAAAAPLEVCAPCHSRRAELGVADPTSFLDGYAPALVDGSDTFWPDGQVREEDFEWTAFVGSRMYVAGVRCVDCHEPHSGRLVREGDALCLGCHAALPAFVAHDPHPAGAAPGCVGCHMPVTVYMQRDPRHDHGFTLPDPAMNVRFGVPDACSRCHTTRTPQWAAAAAERWWGPDGPRHRPRTEAFARARAGDAAAIPALLALLDHEPTPGHRAAAAALLDAFAARDEVRARLERTAVEDEEAVVRFAAVGALASEAWRPETASLLADVGGRGPRAVAVASQRARRASLDPGSPATADYERYLAHNADQPMALLERGSWALERQQPIPALDDLRRALAIDPGSAALYDALGQAWSQYGRPAEAAAALREAVRRTPDEAALWFRLGLAEAGANELEQAQTALERSVALDASGARAWYNLGLLRHQRGGGASAIEALNAAVALAPEDPELLYGLGSVLAQQGQDAAAREVGTRLARVAPQHAGVAQLIGSGRR